MTTPQARDLADTLRGAVPPPPDLTGLAQRAESAGRRIRARRRTASTGGAVAAVAALAVAGYLVSAPTAPDAADAPSPTTAVPCQIGRQDDVTSARPVSIRFCAPERNLPGSAGPPALVPDVALTTDVVATAARLDEKGFGRLDCITQRNPFRIQIGYADGSIADVVRSCDDQYDVLLEAIGQQEAQGQRPLDPEPLGCPYGAPVRTGAGSSDQIAPELRRFPVVDTVRCVGLESEIVSDGESVRAATLSGIRDEGFCVARGHDVVSWALRLADGSTHTVEVDRRRCGVLTVDGVRVGEAGPVLRALADLAPPR